MPRNSTPTPEKVMDMMATRVYTLRKERNWAMAVLSAESGVSSTVISNLEARRRDGIRLAAVLGLAEAFDVSVSYLIGETDAR